MDFSLPEDRRQYLIGGVVTPRYTTPAKSQQTNPGWVVRMNGLDGPAHPSPMLVANDAIPPIRRSAMINTLVNLLGGFYESNDFAKVEAIARTIHKAVPGDEVSLKFLGLVYYRTGRIKDANSLFNRVHRGTSVRPETIETGSSAVMAVSREATRRVPYLAQTWCDLGSALMKQKGNRVAPQSFQKACLA